MQFTGQSDKNDREIYEDDVVKTQWSGLGKVCVGDGSFWFLFEDGAHEVRVSSYETHTRLIDVIGNIYESPELLR